MTLLETSSLDRLAKVTDEWVSAYRQSADERRQLHDQSFDGPEAYDVLGELEITSDYIHGVIATYAKARGLKLPTPEAITKLGDLAVERRPGLASWMAVHREKYPTIVHLFETLDYQRLLFLSILNDAISTH